MGGAKVRRLQATAEDRREEAGELHGVPVLQRRAISPLVGIVSDASPDPGGVRRGVEAEVEGEGLVAGGAAGGGEGVGEGEELVEEVVLRVVRRLPGHARRRGRPPAGDGSGRAGVAAWAALGCRLAGALVFSAGVKW